MKDKEKIKGQPTEKILQSNEIKYSSLFQNMLNGFAYHKILLDEKGNPIDYIFLEMNSIFENFTKLKRQATLGKKVTEIIPGISETKPDLISVYGKVALTGKGVKFELYFEPFRKWYLVSVYSFEKEYFATIFDDITDTKTAEKELINEKNKLQSILSTMDSGVTIRDLDYNLIYQNDTIENMFGNNLGKKCYKAFQGLDEVCEGCPVELSFKDGKQHTATRKVTLQSGEVTFWENTSSPIKDADGKITSCLEVNNNLTKHKKLEIEIQKELQINKAFANLASSLINPSYFLQDVSDSILDHAKSLTNSQHGFVSVIDQETKDNVGYTLTSMMGKSCIVSGEDKRIVFPIRKDGTYPKLWGHALNTMEAFYTNSPMEHEKSMGIPEGHVPIHNFLSAPAIFKNKLVGQIALCNTEKAYTDEDLQIVKKLAVLYALAIHRVQTDDKLIESKRMYSELFSSMRDVIIVADPERNITNANQPALRNKFGYEVDEIIGKQTGVLYAKDTEFKQMGKEVFDRKRNVSAKLIEIDFKKKTGEVFSSELFASKLLNKEGKVIGNIGVIRDITEHKLLESELQNTQKLESVGVLAGGIAHDFNNLLASILLFSNTAKISLEKNSKAYEMLEEIEKSVDNATNLTQQLLTFSKGGTPMKKVLALTSLIHNTVKLILSGSNVRSEISIPDDLLNIEADEGQINQVLSNLIINADQSMPRGGIVKIRAENTEISKDTLPTIKEGKYVAIHIEDSGAGISDEHITKIFDPFFTTKQKGSGLGLAISYSIIKKHEGTITVYSKIAKGTTFNIYLPASEKKIIDEAKTEKIILKGKGRILVMDDNEGIIVGSKKLLTAIGYETDSATDGNEAIEKYTKAKEGGKPYDAVIFDLTVPGGMGGIEAIKRLLEFDPEVKAIVSSGYSDDLAKHSDYGFKAMLTKPYNAETMSKVLHEVIAGKD